MRDFEHNPSVLALLKFLLGRRPQDTAARLALYHYFKNFVGDGEVLRMALFSDFSELALRFEHWREGKQGLERFVRAEIQEFLDSGGEVEGQMDDWRKPTELSLIEVGLERDLEEILHRFLGERTPAGDVFRLLPFEQKWGFRGFSAVFSRASGGIDVDIFDPWMCVRNGNLEPLNLSRRVSYDATLELQLDMNQIVQAGPHSLARFVRHPKVIRGHFIKGYTLLKSEAFELKDLSQLPSLFYAVKSLERLFVNKESDPVYQSVTGLLEEAVKLLQDRDPDSIHFAEKARKQGQLALEHIFVDDRLIFLLLRELDRTLGQFDRRRGEAVP
jgi:hypothetical protein